MSLIARIIPLRQEPASNEAILERIVTEHGPSLRLFLQVRAPAGMEIEDIQQEVFLRLVRLPNPIEQLSKQPDTLRSYLFTIATNLIRDRLRRAKTRHQEQHEPFEEQQCHLQHNGPEEWLTGTQQYQKMRRAIGRLPNKPRQAFILSRYKHYSYRDISEYMNVSVSTVEKYIAEALNALRKELL